VGEIKKLELLHPSEYEHPLDRKALQALEGTPGLESLTRKLFNMVWRGTYVCNILEAT
jgi:hypothetical protein